MAAIWFPDNSWRSWLARKLVQIAVRLARHEGTYSIQQQNEHWRLLLDWKPETLGHIYEGKIGGDE